MRGRKGWLCPYTKKEPVVMDADIVVAEHAQYYTERMPHFLPKKSPERVAEVIAWTGDYCRDRLPAILIVDRESVKRDDDHEGYDQ